LKQETDQADAASADLNVDQVEGQNQAMQKGESRATLKELSHFWTDIEGVMPRVPRLQGASGHLKPLGSLTLGEALCLQVDILLEQIGPLEAVPALMTVDIGAVWKIHETAQGYLPLQPWPGGEK
jgi:hypothetical protein